MTAVPPSAEELVTGTFEVHVFIEPLDPSEELVERFRAACAAAATPMKALWLKLDYVHRGFVGVPQTSRYVEGGLATARAAAAVDMAVLREAGFTILREKIEALAPNDGVPKDAEEARRSPADRYFEFHLLIEGKQGPLTPEDMIRLRSLSQTFSARLGAPVPLSYNALRPSQRFLNLRARGVGLREAMQPVHALEAAIREDGELQVKKVIAEYICFDSNRAVDDGWVEPLP